MAKGYLHVELELAQHAKHEGDVCGDVMLLERTPSATDIILCDGMGHGIKANIAAQMCVTRLMELIKQGITLRDAFCRVVDTMEQAKTQDLPYAVFTVIRILSDGVTTILTYEMPGPIFIAKRYAQSLQQRTISQKRALISEANCHLTAGEGVLIMSDGISMAGLDSGLGMPMGWGVEGVSKLATDQLTMTVSFQNLPNRIMERTAQLWGKKLGDDCTVVLAHCRPGNTVNILTGPPKNPDHDQEVVNKFMMLNGLKVVCGGITAQIASESLGVPLEMETRPKSMLAPPRCFIDGIDLVTEGTITLNQIYNVLDEDPNSLEEGSAVTLLYQMLQNADRVRILLGGAINPATHDISFKQKGILTRQAIVPLLAKKLEDMGKLVIIEQVD